MCFVVSFVCFVSLFHTQTKRRRCRRRWTLPNSTCWKSFTHKKRSRNFGECVCACVRLFMCKIKRGKTDAAVVTTTSNPTTFHYHHPHIGRHLEHHFLVAECLLRLRVVVCESGKSRKSHHIVPFCSLIFPATPLALHCFFSSTLSPSWWRPEWDENGFHWRWVVVEMWLWVVDEWGEGRNRRADANVVVDFIFIVIL